MFNDDTRLVQRMAPMLRRVLVVDPVAASARMLGDLMRDTAHSQIWTAPNNHRALPLCEQVDPQLIFVELSGLDVDGVAFAREVRRSHLNCRQAPIIVVTASPTAGAIVAARDAGVHEFLCKPYTLRELLRRLEAVTLKPRDWVEAVDYIGPDRRRFNSGDYKGPRKRRSDQETTSDAARVEQALKIVKSALMAVDRDPAQVLRALKAQASDLHRAATALGDAPLAKAAGDFDAYLATVTQTGILSPADAFRQAGPLLARLPKEEAARGLAKAG